MVDTSLLKEGNIVGAFGVSGGGLSAIGTILLWVIVSFLIIGIFGLVIWLWYRNKVFNQRVMVFSNIGNKPSLKYEDKARYLSVGTAGDKLFVMQKLKKHLPPPNIQTGKNLWFFWERADGEFINIGIEDLDEIHRKLGVKFVDTDMRMSRVGVQRILEKRLQKQTFWEKYGQTVMGIIFVIFVMIALVVLFTKLVDVSKALEQTAQAVNNMANSVNQFYQAKEGSLAPSTGGSGSSGLVPAGGG